VTFADAIVLRLPFTIMFRRRSPRPWAPFP
jgi:hypothetical protein